MMIVVLVVGITYDATSAYYGTSTTVVSCDKITIRITL